MAVTAFQIGSLVVLGMPKFILEPSAIYLALLEQAVLNKPNIALGTAPVQKTLYHGAIQEK